MCEENRQRKPAPQTIRQTAIPSGESFGMPTVWLTYSFAPLWFEDAVDQAKQPGANARRREIVFSVCFEEAYLVEWVRDSVLSRIFELLSKYFSPGSNKSARDKWNDVPKALHRDGLIPEAPNWGDAVWANWIKLVEMRNGLIHASSSRPETTSLPDKEKPKPPKGNLDWMDAGWAVRVCVALVRRLHQYVGGQVPSWVVDL